MLIASYFNLLLFWYLHFASCTTLCKKCPYSELSWSAFSRIRTEYGETSISPYSIRMQENTDQNNSEYGHFSCSASKNYDWVKGAFLGLRQYLATESSLKTTKKAFYFTSKALFVLKIINLLSWLFGHVAKRLDNLFIYFIYSFI